MANNRTEAANKAAVTKANKLKVMLEKERIKELLWERFLRTAYASNHDDSDWPKWAGERYSGDVIEMVTGDCSLDDEDFRKMVCCAYPPPAPKKTIIELELSWADRKKIIENVQGSCLSDETKKQILGSLGAPLKDPQ